MELKFLVTILFLLKSSSGIEFNYIDTTKWPELQIPNNMCGGTNQSPIRLRDDVSVYNSALTPYYFTCWHDGKEMPFKPSLDEKVDGLTWFNNGHTVGVNFPLNSNKSVRVHFGPRYYRIAQLHWHWGSNSSHGSEHTINGRRFPIEAHLVAFDEKLYGNLTTALQSPSGLHLIGVLFHLVPDNEGLPLMDSLTMPLDEPKNQRVPMENETVEYPLGALPILKLFENRNEEYFRYLGSVTVPPCTENVVWTLAKSTVPITEKQLQRFRKAHFKCKSDAIMQDNFRASQELIPKRADVRPRILMRSFKKEL